jgi:UDP-N-acetylglucosamine acyltransferase
MISETLIHPTAVVDPAAKLHPSVKIGPYAVIGEDVVIGEGSVVGAHAHVEFTHMGKGNRLLPGCFVGGPPQDLKYGGERTRLVMGDNNTVREAVTLNRGTAAHGETRIGNNCLFMAYAHVAHDCVIGDNVVIVNCVGIAGHVEIGDFTVVGGLAGIHQFTKIGRFCMLGGGAKVNKDIPPFCLAQGDRATLRGLNLLGLRRAGFPRETVTAIKDAYKTLFMSGLTQKDALAKIRDREQPAPVLELVDFIERSKRGVTRPASGAAEDEEVSI